MADYWEHPSPRVTAGDQFIASDGTLFDTVEELFDYEESIKGTHE